VGLYLVKRVRDEAHRFAISYHRELRDKGQAAGLLDAVPGLGAKRQMLLRKAFRSHKALVAASLEQVQAVKGIPQEVAADVYAALHSAALDKPVDEPVGSAGTECALDRPADYTAAVGAAAQADSPGNVDAAVPPKRVNSGEHFAGDKPLGLPTTAKQTGEADQ
jgi:excinuclease ABC subunit C